MKNKLLISYILLLALGTSYGNTFVIKTEKKKKESILKKIASSITFDYFVQYMGPSLNQDAYQEGATYNRFKGGRDGNSGARLDTTGSTQIFQSFRLGYKLPKNMILSYNITYQDEVHENIDFEFTNGNKGKRSYGRSFNNHRVALWTPSLFNNRSINLSLTSFYERPTTQGSQDENRQFGLGLQPVLAIKSSIPGLYHGFRASYERNFFENDETESFPQWCIQSGNCQGISKTKKQVALMSVGAYLNYSINDVIGFISNIELDWTQIGEDRDLSNNLDNVGNIGLNFRASKNISFGTGVNFSLEDPSAEKSALFGNMSISL